MTGYDPRRVAPFGDPGIAGGQRLPRAFRRVATSFVGNQRQGIHRVPIISVCTLPCSPMPRSPQGRFAALGAVHRLAARWTPLFSCAWVGPHA
jgi:hypothetical protein